MRTLIALVLLPIPVPVAAQTASASCHILVTGLDFGAYSALTNTPDTAIGRVIVRCPNQANVPPSQVRITTGNSGEFRDRVMISGEAQLHYNLFADPSHRLVLGDGSAGTVPFPPPRAVGIWPIYGRVPPGQRVPAGVYTDSLLVEVEF